MRYKNAILLSVGAIVVLFAAVLFMQPVLIKAVLAKYKSVDHFLIMQTDPRIRYEEHAEKNALVLEMILADTEKKVANILGTPFNQPIQVYVCATQKSFNEYVFLSKNVRGAVYWGKLFLSPGAFSRGSLSNLTAHELTHYLFYTYLGEKASINNIPLWFREGIAVFVANGGALYTAHAGVYEVMEKTERESYLSGEANFWFASKDPRDAVRSNGTVNWLVYRIGALFVHYLHDSYPDQFGMLLQVLLAGQPFDQAIITTFKRDTDALRADFSEYLEVHTNRSQAEQLSARLL